MRRTLIYYCTALFAFLVSTLIRKAGADAIDDALAAANRGDYATAFGISRPLANEGNANAQYIVGVVYD